MQFACSCSICAGGQTASHSASHPCKHTAAIDVTPSDVTPLSLLVVACTCHMLWQDGLPVVSPPTRSFDRLIKDGL